MAKAGREIREFNEALLESIKGLTGFSDAAGDAARDTGDFGDAALQSKQGLAHLTSAAFKAGKAIAFGAAVQVGMEAAEAFGITPKAVKEDWLGPRDRTLARAKKIVGDIEAFGGEVSEEQVQQIIMRIGAEETGRGRGRKKVRREGIDWEFLESMMWNRQNRYQERAEDLHH
jgi:hypothetical protein